MKLSSLNRNRARVASTETPQAPTGPGTDEAWREGYE